MTWRNEAGVRPRLPAPPTPSSGPPPHPGQLDGLHTTRVHDGGAAAAGRRGVTCSGVGFYRTSSPRPLFLSRDCRLASQQPSRHRRRWRPSGRSEDGFRHSFHPAAAELGVRGAQGRPGEAVGSGQPRLASAAPFPPATLGFEAFSAETPLGRDLSLSPPLPTGDPFSPGHIHLHPQPLTLPWPGTPSRLRSASSRISQPWFLRPQPPACLSTAGAHTAVPDCPSLAFPSSVHSRDAPVPSPSPFLGYPAC